jgi:hypothetical protein
VSAGPFDALNGRLKMKVRFVKFSGENFSLPDYSPLPKKQSASGKTVLDNYDDKDVIRIEQTISSEKSGLPIVALFLYFAHGRGLVRAEGRVITQQVRYELQKIG